MLAGSESGTLDYQKETTILGTLLFIFFVKDNKQSEAPLAEFQALDYDS